jgi:sulfite exporter TauE/SafE
MSYGRHPSLIFWIDGACHGYFVYAKIGEYGAGYGQNSSSKAFVLMSLFMTLLPLYLFGNLHCFGMCGPLAMTISHHRYRALYFLGRLLSFTFAGAFAGSLGFVLQIFLSRFAVGALLSLGFGLFLIVLGFSYFIPLPRLPFPAFHRRMASLNRSLSFLILKDQPLPTFLFGFFTLFLPCGQTLIVFSACALAGSLSIGALNGFLFALITSPSLFLAMSLSSFFRSFAKVSDYVMGLTAIIVGIFAFLRGLADLDAIPHLVLHDGWHIVLW